MYFLSTILQSTTNNGNVNDVVISVVENESPDVLTRFVRKYGGDEPVGLYLLEFYTIRCVTRLIEIQIKHIELKRSEVQIVGVMCVGSHM